MLKRILAFIIVAILVSCLVACDEEEQKPITGDPNEIDVSTGGFFDDGASDTTDTAEAVDTDTAEIVDTDTAEVADTADAAE